MHVNTNCVRTSWRVLVIAGLVFPVSAGLAATGGSERESSLRRIIAWQVALDHVGFSPGLIDGTVGPKTRLATAEFQRVHGLPQTGELDEATARSLRVDPDNVLGRYTVESADLDEIGPVPTSWMAKSQLKRLGHESLDTVLAEKFHCTRGLLATLNPGKGINGLKAGDKVVVPILPTAAEAPKAAYVEVNLAEKIIRVIDDQRRLAALFHCSVAADKGKLPAHDGRVACVVQDPWYTFDPDMWKEVKERVPGKLAIPPGPRNPVGRCWIGLSLPGYGMHGTPNPELIGKTGSHGCFRLANWDVQRLARMVKVGTPVKFVNESSMVLARR
jgi:lipoprotein-anchoring transpeptidase ErfK/SrfK